MLPPTTAADGKTLDNGMSSDVSSLSRAPADSHTIPQMIQLGGHDFLRPMLISDPSCALLHGLVRRGRQGFLLHHVLGCPLDVVQHPETHSTGAALPAVRATYEGDDACT